MSKPLKKVIIASTIATSLVASTFLQAAAKTKLVKFPNNTSLGNLYELKPPTSSWISHRSILNQNRFISQAQGIISVPTEVRLWLDCAEIVVGHPALLDGLAPDALVFLRIRGVGAKDNILPYIVKLSGLMRLDLKDCEFSNAGLSQIKALTNLESLSIRGCGVNGRFFKDLGALKKLKFLDTGNNFIDAQAWRSIAQFKGLQELNANRTNLTDEGLVYLSGLPNLTTLDIARNLKITGRGLSHLKRIGKLKELLLANTGVTIKDILGLKGLQLVSLSLPTDKLTKSERAQLQAAFPHCYFQLTKPSTNTESDWSVIFGPISR